MRSAAALALLACHGGASADPAASISSGKATEVPIEKSAPALPGRPLSSVVVTQCNLIVAVYLTLPDGKLLRFDSTASIPAQELMGIAYTAVRSERVEVSCNETGAVGYKSEKPI
jgi:hypothetical protein